MLCFTGMLLLLGLHTGLVYGMNCPFGTRSNDNFIGKAISQNVCPGLFQSSDKSFCCYDIPNDSYYCCDGEEFAIKTGIGIIIPVVVAVVIIVLLITCCISCLCCSCCPWYRRRHPGTVYGKVQAPNVVNVIHHPTNVPPAYTNEPMQNQYVANPPYPTVMPQPPPQYTSEAYAQQASYNPSYKPQ